MHFVLIQTKYDGMRVGNKLEMVLNPNKGIISTLGHNYFEYCAHTCM